ncbi:MAG: sugar phosphate isomerase/epimerase family protein [Planctomycetota bacterium]|jgi:sugar phosphate isomerase/epimerase
MKYGLFTVSVPAYEPIEAMKVAKEIGYDGMEWRVTEDTGDRENPTYWSGNRTSMTAKEVIEKADELKKAAAEIGMEMEALGTYIDCTDAGAVELHMEAAAALGAKSIRVGPGKYPSDSNTPYPEMVKICIKQYSEVAKLAEKYSVKGVIETHMNQLAPSTTKAMTILSNFDPAYVGIMWDPGNQVVEGFEPYEQAIEIAGPYLSEVHIKNMRFVKGEVDRGQQLWTREACPVDQGIVNWYEVMKALKKHNYNGWLNFEDFSNEMPLLEKLKHNLEFIKKCEADA